MIAVRHTYVHVARLGNQVHDRIANPQANWSTAAAAERPGATANRCLAGHRVLVHLSYIFPTHRKLANAAELRLQRRRGSIHVISGVTCALAYGKHALAADGVISRTLREAGHLCRILLLTLASAS